MLSGQLLNFIKILDRCESFLHTEVALSETDINHCNSEEAYPSIVCHFIMFRTKGYTNVSVKTVDSDVVIVMLYLTYGI